MKGIVFTTLFEMLEKAHGLDFVDDLIARSDLPSGGSYTAVGTYSHQEIVELVTQLSEVTHQSPSDLLRGFGTYLFQKLAGAYPDFINRSNNLLDFLENVETYIHVEVQKLYPEAELPRFECERLPNGSLNMVYYSARHFEDLCEGLLRGACEQFNTPSQITRETLPNGAERFLIAPSLPSK